MRERLRKYLVTNHLLQRKPNRNVPQAKTIRDGSADARYVVVPAESLFWPQTALVPDHWH